jgi:hypothetical protein
MLRVSYMYEGVFKKINKHINVLQPYLQAFPVAVLPVSLQLRKLSFQEKLHTDAK